MLTRYLADDPGAAPGLQRPDAHHPPRRPAGHRLHPRRRRSTAPAGGSTTSASAWPLTGSSPTGVATGTRRRDPAPPSARRLRRLRPHPVLRPAVRLLRVRHLDRSGAPDRRLPRRGARRDRAGGRRRACPAATSVFFGGGTPSLVPADGLMRRARRHRRGRRAPRSPSSATPTRSPTSCWRPTGPAGSTGCRSACSRWSPTCWSGSGRTHDPANVERAVRRRPARAGFDVVQPRPHLRRRRRVGRRLAATLERVLALEPPHVSAYGLTVEAGHAAGRRPGPPSRRRRPGRQVPAGRRRCSARPASSGTRSRTGPDPATSAGTTSSTGRQGDYRGLRLRGPLAPRRPALVERAHARALHRRRSRPARSAEGGPRCSTTRPAASRGCSSRCARPSGVPADALADDAGELDGLVERARRSGCVLTVAGRLLANEVALRLA